ncbi:hypothetical protein Taro_022218 [Colocasia esculenta]|uniref:adenine phosphoribosyltransferase n=1 Tax=Colocasia esculenta TaxID=4460 RepID=A0A843V3A0_COLES|nr:hypothetical protein [Colocasia esculenta]
MLYLLLLPRSRPLWRASAAASSVAAQRGSSRTPCRGCAPQWPRSSKSWDLLLSQRGPPREPLSSPRRITNQMGRAPKGNPSRASCLPPIAVPFTCRFLLPITFHLAPLSLSLPHSLFFCSSSFSCPVEEGREGSGEAVEEQSTMVESAGENGVASPAVTDGTLVRGGGGTGGGAVEDPRLQAISAAIRVVPHFPKPGIMFNDITTLLLRPKVFKDAVDLFVNRYKDMMISTVAGIAPSSAVHRLLLLSATNFCLTDRRKSPRNAEKVFLGVHGTDGYGVRERTDSRMDKGLVLKRMVIWDGFETDGDLGCGVDDGLIVEGVVTYLCAYLDGLLTMNLELVAYLYGLLAMSLELGFGIAYLDGLLAMDLRLDLT